MLGGQAAPTLVPCDLGVGLPGNHTVQVQGLSFSHRGGGGLDVEGLGQSWGCGHNGGVRKTKLLKGEGRALKRMPTGPPGGTVTAMAARHGPKRGLHSPEAKTPLDPVAGEQLEDLQGAQSQSPAERRGRNKARKGPLRASAPHRPLLPSLTRNGVWAGGLNGDLDRSSQDV